MKKPHPLFLLPTILLFLSGCAANVAPRAAPENRAPVTNQEIPFFSYEHTTPNADVTPSWSYESKTHDVFTVSFDSVTAGERIRAEYWKQKSPGKKKLVIVLPIIDSIRFVGEHYAHVLTAWNGNNEFNVLLVEDTKKISYLPELSRVKTKEQMFGVLATATESIRQYVIDVRRLIDWAETRHEIDSKKIGIIGGSVSAYLASLVMAADSRIIAGVLDKGGGSWQTFFAYSEEWETMQTRNIILKRFGLTQSKFEEIIQTIMRPVDPIRWANRICPERVLLISARDDTWIPKESTRRFWEALGKPERIEYFASHKIAFAFSLTILGGHYADFKIYNHFKKNLD